MKYDLTALWASEVKIFTQTDRIDSQRPHNADKPSRNPYRSVDVREANGESCNVPPLVSLGPGAGYRTHIVAESDAKHQPEALAGLRVVSEIAAARLADDEQRRRTEAPIRIMMAS